MSTTKNHQVWIADRTQIKIIVSIVSAYCYHCHKNVYPEVIVTAFLSMPLSVCPTCRTVIQGN